MYIHRELERTIAPFIKRKEVMAIIGPRQAGKTTFLQFLQQDLVKQGKKVKFITFENLADLEIFQDSIDDFVGLMRSYDVVIIDEFQYARDGGQKLKYLFDTTKTKYIISGSSSLDLVFQTGKYMVGRMLNFELMPFSFREFLAFKDKDLSQAVRTKIDIKKFTNLNVQKGFGNAINKRLAEQLEKFVVYGGYPAVALASSEAVKQKILSSILENYLLKDIRSLLRLATDDKLLRLAKFLAAQIGGLIKYEELSNVANLSYQEVLRHLNILEKTFIINVVRPFFTNKRTELSKNPKVYFVDMGVRNFLLSDFRPIKIRSDVGLIMENYAHSLIKNLGIFNGVKYWRTKSKAEVDFVVEKQQQLLPVEIKYTSKATISRSFYSFIEKFKPKTGIILTRDYLGEKKIKNTRVKFMPLSYF